MAIDWTKPAVTDNYLTGFTQGIIANFTALGQWLDSSVSGVYTGTPPANTKRLNSSTGLIEFWNTALSTPAWSVQPMGYVSKLGDTVTGPLILAPTAGGNALRIISNNAYIDFYNVGTTARSGYIQFNAAGAGVVFQSEAAGSIIFNVGGGQKMLIDSSNVTVTNTLYYGGGVTYNADTRFGLSGVDSYFNTYNAGITTFPVYLGYNRGTSVVCGPGSANGSIPLYASTLYDNGNRPLSASFTGTFPGFNGFSPSNGLLRNSSGGLLINSGSAGLVWINYDNGASSTNYQFAVGTGAGATAFSVQANGNTFALGSITGLYLVAASSSTAGTLYFGSSAAHYLTFDGTNTTLNAGNLACSGSVTATSPLFGNLGTKGYGAITTTTSTATPTGGYPGDFVFQY